MKKTLLLGAMALLIASAATATAPVKRSDAKVIPSTQVQRMAAPNVEIKTKSGSTIKGSTLQETKVVNIGITETGFNSEAELFREMESYIKDLDK